MGKYSLKNIYDVLAGTNFYTDYKKYAFLKLNKHDYTILLRELTKLTNQYVEVINDKDELSLIVLKETWENSLSKKLKAVASMGEIALITCEVKKETVTGYLLSLISILSPHNISVYVQGAYTTDHIFVNYENLEEALKLLSQLKS